MAYKLSVDEGVLQAELFNRETEEETEDFLRALAHYSRRYSSILMQVSWSKPIFFRSNSTGSSSTSRSFHNPHRIRAPCSPTPRIFRQSHEYLKLIARQPAAGA